MPQVRHGPGTRCASGSRHAHRIHVPDASRNRAPRARLLPDLRHGARTAHRARGGRRKSGTRFDDAALLDQRLRSPFRCLRWACPTCCRARPFTGHLSMRAMGWMELALATPVVLWGGWPFFERGWASLVNRSLNMFTLIAIGTGTAYVYSVIAVLFPGIFPASFRSDWARCPFISKPRPRSPPWSCWARFWNCARAAAPPPQSGHC